MSIKTRSRQYGKVFDHWQIREFLGAGSGGKSAVFRLVHTESASVQSAMKVISLIEVHGNFESLSESKKAEYLDAKQKCKDCAEQEVLLMNNLQGRTNVVDYLDHDFIDWADESGFGCDMLIRMESLKDLRSEIEEGRKFTQDEILKIGRDMCTALVLCHRKNILHRDIKPENIFFNKDGNYKLGDFGISRILSAAPMSKASTSICTPEYAAPEQISGHYDKRVDIYSLGLVLYELSNGNRLPFASSSYITAREAQERMLGKPLQAPSNADKSLSAVILKACAFQPDDRYQTAEEFLGALNRLDENSPRPVMDETPVVQSRKKPAPANFATQKATPANEGYLTEPAVLPAKPKDEPNKKKRKMLPLLVSVVVVIMLALVCLHFCSNNQNDQNHADDEQQSTQEQSAESSAAEDDLKVKDITAGAWYSVALYEDGTVEAVGNNNHKQCDVSSWVDITAVAAGNDHTVGLKSNGTVVAAGNNTDGQCNVWKWTDIASVWTGSWHTLGLKTDGTVVATGYTKAGQCDVSGWSEIVAIAGGNNHTIGLKSDGTAVATGYNEYNQCEISDWSEIVAIAAGFNHTVALKADGTVVAAGLNQAGQCDVSGWTDIVAIAADGWHTIGLKSDGTVVATGHNEDGQCDVSEWRSIIAIVAGDNHTIGLKSDGTLVATGYNAYGQCDMNRLQ